jgi:hypothetical protein
MAPSDSRNDERPRKPMSVRDVVGGRKRSVRDGGAPSGASAESVPPSSTDASAAVSRSFSDGESVWTVRIAGAGRSGTAPDCGVHLMHLTFTKGSESDPARELLCAGHGLEDIPDEELRTLLERSRPVEGRRDPTS